MPKPVRRAEGMAADTSMRVSLETAITLQRIALAVMDGEIPMPNEDDILNQRVHDAPTPERSSNARRAIELLDDLEFHVERMYANAQDFVMKKCDKRDTYGDRMFVSDAELDYLELLHGQYCK